MQMGWFPRPKSGRGPAAGFLHNAAMDLWDVATEEDPAQMWEEARAIGSRILAACPTAWPLRDFPRAITTCPVPELPPVSKARLDSHGLHPEPLGC